MIIGELDCRDFGCLHEKKIALSPGINLTPAATKRGSPRRLPSFAVCLRDASRQGKECAQGRLTID